MGDRACGGVELQGDGRGSGREVVDDRGGLVVGAFDESSGRQSITYLIEGLAGAVDEQPGVGQHTSGRVRQVSDERVLQEMRLLDDLVGVERLGAEAHEEARVARYRRAAAARVIVVHRQELASNLSISLYRARLLGCSRNTPGAEICAFLFG